MEQLRASKTEGQSMPGVIEVIFRILNISSVDPPGKLSVGPVERVLPNLYSLFSRLSKINLYSHKCVSFAFRCCPQICRVIVETTGILPLMPTWQQPPLLQRCLQISSPLLIVPPEHLQACNFSLRRVDLALIS